MPIGAVITIALTAAIIIGSFAFARRVGKNLTQPSDEDIAAINRLTETGTRARATLTSIRPTGLTINNFNVQVEVSFWLEPLDGSPEFEGTKKMFFLETQFPRQGDVWPAWFDPADRATFAVAVPHKLDTDQIAMYREFGIEHPLDD